MNKNRKMILLTLIVVAVVLGAFLIFSLNGGDKQTTKSDDNSEINEDNNNNRNSNDNNDSNNNKDDKDKNSDNDSNSNEDSSENSDELDYIDDLEDGEAADELTSTKEVIFKNGGKFNELSFSKPETLAGFYEDEVGVGITGFSEGNLISFTSEGYQQIFTYDIKMDKRKIYDDFTEFQYTDPKEKQSIYVKQSNMEDFDAEHKDLIFVRIGFEKEKIGEISDEEYIHDGFVFNDIFIYSYNDNEHRQSSEDVGLEPLPHIEDKAFYDKLNNAISEKKITNIATDGDRLLVIVKGDDNLYDVSDGTMKSIGKLPKERVDIKNLVVKGDNYGYYVAYENYDTDKPEVIINGDVKLEEEDFLYAKFLDENNIIYGSEIQELKIYNIKNNDIANISNVSANFFVSDNKLLFMEGKEIKISEFKK